MALPIEGLISLYERGLKRQQDREDRPRDVAEQIARQAILDAQVEDIPAARSHTEFLRQQDVLNANRAEQRWDLGLPELKAEAARYTPGTPEYEEDRARKAEQAKLLQLQIDSATAEAAARAREPAERAARERAERLKAFGDMIGTGVGGGKSYGEAAFLAGLTPEDRAELQRLAYGDVPRVPDVSSPTAAAVSVARAVGVPRTWAQSYSPSVEAYRRNLESLAAGRDVLAEDRLGLTAPSQLRMQKVMSDIAVAAGQMKLTSAQTAKTQAEAESLQRELAGILSEQELADLALARANTTLALMRAHKIRSDLRQAGPLGASARLRAQQMAATAAVSMDVTIRQLRAQHSKVFYAVQVTTGTQRQALLNHLRDIASELKTLRSTQQALQEQAGIRVTLPSGATKPPAKGRSVTDGVNPGATGRQGDRRPLLRTNGAQATPLRAKPIEKMTDDEVFNGMMGR